MFPTVITLVVQMKKQKEYGNGSQKKLGISPSGQKVNPIIYSASNMAMKTIYKLGQLLVMEIAYGMIFTTRRTHGRTATS